MRFVQFLPVHRGQCIHSRDVCHCFSSEHILTVKLKVCFHVETTISLNT